MELDTFRSMILRYRQRAGCAQATLAREVGLHPSVLSRKLHGSGSPLTAPEIRQLVRALAARGALSSRDQVYELLTAAGVGRHLFGPAEWATPPLSLLAGPTAAPADRGDADVAAVRVLLRRPGVRVVALVGGPRVGKTRVALRVAEREAGSFPGGVCVLTVAASASRHEVAAAARQALRRGSALLVLDGFERGTATPGEVAGLLAASPGSKALITSRRTLGLTGARELHLS